MHLPRRRLDATVGEAAGLDAHEPLLLPLIVGGLSGLVARRVPDDHIGRPVVDHLGPRPPAASTTVTGPGRIHLIRLAGERQSPALLPVPTRSVLSTRLTPSRPSMRTPWTDPTADGYAARPQTRSSESRNGLGVPRCRINREVRARISGARASRRVRLARQGSDRLAGARRSATSPRRPPPQTMDLMASNASETSMPLNSATVDMQADRSKTSVSPASV